jgi:hypothetical protein
MIKRMFDDDTGIIYVTGKGAWTRAAVDHHYDELRTMIEALRAEGRPIRVLSDVTGAQRQDRMLEEHIKDQIARTFQSGDRFAIQTYDAADKAYVRMIVGRGDVAVFASRLPAEMWLLLDELPEAM